MTINSADIKLMQPERLTDDEDGGGQMTGLEVIDGDINNLFEDISRVNRTYGNVSLRKAFLKVDTATADLYLDAHSILSAQPEDPNVSGLIFTTNDFYDERLDAQQRIESFVVKSYVTGLHLRGTQLQGQQTIIVYAAEVNATPTPEIGDTMVLQVEDDLASQQYIKVMNIEQTKETFIYAIGSSGEFRTFVVDQYILTLSAELKQDFPAGSPVPFPNNATKLYSTQPAVSAKYYGTTTLAEAVTGGDTVVKVASTFAPIIPTASSETAIIDQRPGGFLNQVVPSAPANISVSVTVTSGTQSQLPTAIVPGTMSLTVSGTAYTDKGGIFINASSLPGQLEGTTIDYRTGSIVWGGVAAGTVEVSYKPGALRQQLPNTGRIEIGENNRNFNYVLALEPAPAPTTFHASYQYLGKWYELVDDGSGTLVGDGTGQINYSTGSVILTLQAQPDAGSVIFFRWTEGGIYSMSVAQAFSSTAPATLTLPNRPVVPGSLTLTWLSGGVSKTATDTAGAISGDAVGKINYATGRISLTAADAPDADGFHADYDYKSGAPLINSTTVPANTTRADIVLASTANVKPGSIAFSIKKSVKRVVVDNVANELGTNYRDNSHEIADDADGNLIDRRTQENIGSVNYTTGLITIIGTTFLKPLNVTRSTPTVALTTRTEYDRVVMSSNLYYEVEEATEEIRTHDVHVNYKLAADPEVSGSSTIGANAVPWKFPLASHGPIVPGSVILSIDGALFYDDGLGNILRNYSTTTGTGTAVGAIDYESTNIEITAYSGRPIVNTVTPVACLIGDDWSFLVETTFRAPAPLRSSGFTVRANDLETDEQYTATADSEGLVTGDGITGQIDLQNGVAELIFPVPVLASTIFFNAVSFKQVPLNPDILGLDPVRLPSDGRVPIVRDADILVFTHTQRDLIDTPAANLVIDAARDLLHDAWIEDENGTRLNPAQYTLDKDAGTATLADPFTAEDEDEVLLVGDLFFVHRVDDMALCTEARIDGTLQLAQPIYHDLPAVDTWVASAVYLGDLRGRVKDWVSYTTEPADYDATGTETTAQYNQIAYPIAIDNRGSVPERWKIRFTSTTAFSLYGENRGLVATGSINADFSPTNPQTGTPYFTIESDGWGAGWAIANTVRFDTEAAAAPLWFIRTVLPGMATVNDDQLKIELRGDHN